MKKMFTLIVSVTLFSSAFAQYNAGSQKDHSYDKGKNIVFNDNRNKKDDNRFDDKYSFLNKQRDMQIMQINREYDNKIQAVKNKLFINRFKKTRMIAKLEDQRNDELKAVYAKFNSKQYDKKSNGHW